MYTEYIFFKNKMNFKRSFSFSWFKTGSGACPTQSQPFPLQMLLNLPSSSNKLIFAPEFGVNCISTLDN